MSTTATQNRYKIQVTYRIDPAQIDKFKAVSTQTKIPMSVMLGDFADWIGVLDKPVMFKSLLNEASRVASKKRLGETVTSPEKVGIGFAISPEQKKNLDFVAENTDISRPELVGSFIDWIDTLKDPANYKTFLYQAVRLETLRGLSNA